MGFCMEVHFELAGTQHVMCMQANVGEVSTASVACGVLGVGGNKGGVAVSFTLYRRRLCCVSSHFAAHQVLLLTNYFG